MNQELENKIATIKEFLDEIDFTYEVDESSEDNASIEFDLEEKGIVYQNRITISGVFIVAYCRLPILIDKDQDSFLRIINFINLNIPMGNFELTEEDNDLVFRTSFTGESQSFNKEVLSHLIYYPAFLISELFTLLSSFQEKIINFDETMIKLKEYFNDEDADILENIT